ncbi:MAG TPA: PEP-CTERM sorting domain-containing protein [Verrucomicrobiota bacterium]|nr:PEP-CTERM sorting domain-containing protein [Verrucomicrobiota bacterium]HNU52120.1 PEP-CTERM sorting domain-containing protein [Verrucomicrobiota bacterium]
MRLPIAIISLLFACSTFAATIGYNFVSDWPAPTISGQVADGFDLWTDSVDENAPGEGTEVPKSTDPYAVTTPVNAAMVNVAWSSANMWDAGNEDNADQGLYRVYLDDGGSGITVTVSGLSSWLSSVGDSAYQLRFYRSTDNGGAGFSALSVYDGVGTGGTLLETIPTVVPGDPSIGDGAYPTGTGGGGVRLAQDAAGMFTADTITFYSVREAAIGGVPVRGCIAGFKVTSVPEPGVGLMLLIGLGGLGFALRRR